MAIKPRKKGSTFRPFVLALISCLALAAASAPAASALSFQGETPAEFTLSGGQFTALGTENVWCEGETTGDATMEDEAHGIATLRFHGCWGFSPSGKPNCESSGAGKGTIVTRPLEMDLAELPGGAIGTVLTPIGKNFAEFTCAGIANVVWSGGVIGEITEPGYNESSSTLHLDFDAPGGNQEYTETADGQGAHLEGSINGGKGFKVGLDSFAGVSAEGQEFELSTDAPGKSENPQVILPGGYPASWNWTGVGATLRVSSTMTVSCPLAKGKLTTGSGELSNSTSGVVELTFRNCTGPLGVKCTSSGQESGTIKTQALPVQLAYLSDGSPGVAIEANKSSGKVMEFKCSFLASTIVTGGVLGKIISPAAGEADSLLDIDLNVVQEGEEYVQEYPKAEGGLQATINGGEAEPTTLDLGAAAGFGGGYFMLRE